MNPNVPVKTSAKTPVKTVLAAALTLATLNALAQEALTPAIPGVVNAGTRIELIKDGFKGTEGPIAAPDGSVLFTENQNARVIRIAPDGSTSVFLDKTNGVNALAYAPTATWWPCRPSTRRSA
jgi:gluconolactonase